MTIGSGGFKSSEGSHTLIGSKTKALVFCENGQLCKTVWANAGRPRDDNGPCGWNAGGQYRGGFNGGSGDYWKSTSSGETLPQLCGIQIRPGKAGSGGGGIVIWGSSPVYGPGSGEGFGGGAGRLQGTVIHANPGVAVVMVC